MTRLGFCQHLCDKAGIRHTQVAYGKEELDEEVRIMQEFYARLKEKSKRKPAEVANYAEDWMNYIVHKNSIDTYHHLTLEEHYSVYEQRIKDDEMRERAGVAQEIENRFARHLGTEAEKKLADFRRKQEEETQKFWGDDES